MQFTTASATTDMTHSTNVPVNLSSVLKSLDGTIAEKIKEGWKPSGSVSVAMVGSSLVAVQGLTK